MIVFVLPPNESCNKRVSLESRYGMWWVLPSTNADITLPNALNDKLIFVAYFIPSPVAPVLLARYEPAKSTKFNFDALYFSSPLSSCYWESMYMLKILCDRDDYAFIFVALVALFLKPAYMYFYILVIESTSICVRSFMKIPLSGLYLRSILALVSFPNKSWISSL